MSHTNESTIFIQADITGKNLYTEYTNRM